MRELQSLVEQHTDASGAIIWPASPTIRQELARALYGRGLTSVLDYWLEYGFDLLHNPNPTVPFERENDVSKHDSAFRATLSTLTSDQKAVVERLLLLIASGVVFSSQVALDQPPVGTRTAITYVDEEGDALNPIRISLGEIDLHDEVSYWIWNFSHYAEQLVVREENATGVWYQLR